MPCERNIVIEAQGFESRHHVVRAVGRFDLEAAFPQPGDDRIAPLLVVADQLQIKGRGKLERRGDRDLQRVSRADGQEVVDLGMPAVSSGGAMSQPMRQPVTEYVLLAPLMVIVRSFIPGSVARLMWLPR